MFWAPLTFLRLRENLTLKKVISASSVAVYGVPKVTPIRKDHPLNPINLYGAMKLLARRLLSHTITIMV